MSAEGLRLRAAVAIPAKNEERDLAACLRALASQRDARGRALPQGTFGVVLLLNNCDDGSSEVARSMARDFPSPLRVVERVLPARLANAGGARRMAMDMAAAWLEDWSSDGLLLTTDADSRVGPTWIIDNLDAAERGVDAVAGDIALETEDESALPQMLRERGRLESTYERQLLEISALLDPRPHNPWPHHGVMSGASLAVRLSSYRRIGGLPALPLGEDKALIAALEAQDARIRFSPDIRVITSGRLQGRAAGGVADTIRIRCEDPLALCDEALEPVSVSELRARWRGRLRRLHSEGRLGNIKSWASPLGIHPADAIHLICFEPFGAFWHQIERTSPFLRRQRLRPAQLPIQIRLAKPILERLRWSSRSRDDVQTELLEPLLSDDGREAADLGEENLGGVVA